jgi:protein ImuA
VGDPCWNVELTRIRNGKPGAWDLTWKNGRFEQMQQAETTVIHAIQKAVS